MEAEVLGGTARAFERVEDCTHRVEDAAEDDGK